MMNPGAHLLPTTARVSIAERIVPLLGFALAAISGIIGALMILRFLGILYNSENAGHAAFFGGKSEVEFAVGITLILAAGLCGVGVLHSIVRLFTTNTTATPSGILFLLAGIFGLLPPISILYLLRMMRQIVLREIPTDGGISSIGQTIDYVCYSAIGSAFLIVLVLLVLAFIPFKSGLGRRVFPLVALVLMTIATASLAGAYFWEGSRSITERNSERPYFPADPEAPENSDANFNINSNTNEIINDEPIVDPNPDGRTKPIPKTISGGVLNGKAIERPQPVYPPAARAVRAAGQVSVQVVVDEKGDVESASAVSGHPLLRAAAVEAARRAKFAPTKLSGYPVKVSGVLTYNFGP